MKKIRRLVLALVIAFGGAISPVTAAQAFQPAPIAEEWFYYSEFQQINLVGHYIHRCDDEWTGSWGLITEWSVYSSPGCS